MTFASDVFDTDTYRDGEPQVLINARHLALWIDLRTRVDSYITELKRERAFPEEADA
jgi:phage anti-repressor protein